MIFTETWSIKWFSVYFNAFVRMLAAFCLMIALEEQFEGIFSHFEIHCKHSFQKLWWEQQIWKDPKTCRCTQHIPDCHAERLTMAGSLGGLCWDTCFTSNWHVIFDLFLIIWTDSYQQKDSEKLFRNFSMDLFKNMQTFFTDFLILSFILFTLQPIVSLIPLSIMLH